MGCVRRLALAIGCLVILGCTSNNPLEPGVPGSAPEFAEGSTGSAIVDIAGLGPQRVEYEIKNGRAIYSGDIELSPEQLSGLGDPRTTSTGRRLQTYRWSNGVIPFSIDRTNIPVNGSVDQAITAAMNAWSAATWIKFTPFTGSGDYVFFTAALPAGQGGLSSSVGRIAGSGKHTITLATDVGCCVGVPTHEIGHMIGLYHEQERADRDTYLKVYDGISPAGCTPGVNCLPNHFDCTNGGPCNNGTCTDGKCCNPGKGNYLRYSAEPVGVFGNDGIDLAPGLEFTSIMMYAGDTTGCCGLPCMTDLNGNAFPGRSEIATAQDFAGVKQLYQFVITPWLYSITSSSVLL